MSKLKNLLRHIERTRIQVLEFHKTISLVGQLFARMAWIYFNLVILGKEFSLSAEV